MKKLLTTIVALMISMSAFAHGYTTVVYQQPGIVSCAFGVVASACHLVGSILEPRTYVTTQYCPTSTCVTSIPATPAIPTVNTVNTIPTAIIGTPAPQVVTTPVVPTTQVVAAPAAVNTVYTSIPTTISSVSPSRIWVNGVQYRLLYKYVNGRYHYYYKPIAY